MLFGNARTDKLFWIWLCPFIYLHWWVLYWKIFAVDWVSYNTYLHYLEEELIRLFLMTLKLRKISAHFEFLLFQARAHISKLIEEKTSVIEHNKRLQQELVWNSYWIKNKIQLILILCKCYLECSAGWSWCLSYGPTLLFSTSTLWDVMLLICPCRVMKIIGWTELNIHWCYLRIKQCTHHTSTPIFLFSFKLKSYQERWDLFVP